MTKTDPRIAAGNFLTRLALDESRERVAHSLENMAAAPAMGSLRSTGECDLDVCSICDHDGGLDWWYQEGAYEALTVMDPDWDAPNNLDALDYQRSMGIPDPWRPKWYRDEYMAEPRRDEAAARHRFVTISTAFSTGDVFIIDDPTH